jgi:hypothetical protein
MEIQVNTVINMINVTIINILQSMPSIQQYILQDDSNDKRSLIPESVMAIWIGVHPIGEEPD